MATPTYTLIDSVTLGASAASVTFSGIPTDGTYRDLILVCQAKSTSGECELFCRINGDSADSYAYVQAYTYNTSNGGAGGTGDRMYLTTRAGSTTDPTNCKAHFMDYAVTNKHTTIISTSGAAQNGVNMIATKWPNNAAVNSLLIYGQNPYAAGSTFFLYGIAA